MNNLFTLFIISLFTITLFNPSFSQIQVGSDINGEAGDLSGDAVSLSANGNRVAIGAVGSSEFTGHVRIYEQNGENWVQVGADIDGDTIQNRSGNAVSLSANGSRVAIGAFRNAENGFASGQMRLFELNGENWSQIGTSLYGNAGTNFGISISLSADGNRVIAGGGGSGDIPFSGAFLIYDVVNEALIQVGATIEGETVNELLGRVVSISQDGNRIAVLAINYARVYEWDQNNWVQMGSDITSPSGIGILAVAVSLSGYGNRLGVIVPGDSGTIPTPTTVQVYEWDGENWIQIGIDIDIDREKSISLSADGNRIAIGGGDAVSSPGFVRVFDLINENWMQVGIDMEGESPGDQFGNSISLSANGNRIAIGAPLSQEGAGHVRVFDLPIVSTVTTESYNTMQFFPNPTSGKIEISSMKYDAIRVIDQFGRVLWKNGSPQTEIDLSPFPDGIYFIQVHIKDQILTKRVLKI